MRRKSISGPAVRAAPLSRVAASGLRNYIGQIVSCSFIVLSKQERKKRNGNPFLQLRLGDATGQVEANIWHNAADANKGFEAGHVLEVCATVVVYEGRLQLDIHRLRLVPRSEIDAPAYPPGTTGEPDEFAGPDAGGYLEPGNWLLTCENEEMKTKALARLDQVTQRLSQTHSSEPTAIGGKDDQTMPDVQHKRLAESQTRIRDIRRKYGGRTTDVPTSTRDGDDF
ncbi:MAG: OB-fold nucleic acid binding domain-containing protein [Terriglobales bacterium]